jgi:hypothetical protein
MPPLPQVSNSVMVRYIFSGLSPNSPARRAKVSSVNFFFGSISDWTYPHLVDTKISVEYNKKRRKRWERKTKNGGYTPRSSKPKR